MRNFLLFALSTGSMLALVTMAARKSAGPAAQGSQTSETGGITTTAPAMMTGRNGWRVEPLFTVGEEINGYRPPGILDGIGAMEIRPGVVRILVNHEIGC